MVEGWVGALIYLWKIPRNNTHTHTHIRTPPPPTHTVSVCVFDSLKWWDQHTYFFYTVDIYRDTRYLIYSVTLTIYYIKNCFYSINVWLRGWILYYILLLYYIIFLLNFSLKVLCTSAPESFTSRSFTIFVLTVWYLYSIYTELYSVFWFQPWINGRTLI